MSSCIPLGTAQPLVLWEEGPGGFLTSPLSFSRLLSYVSCAAAVLW